MKIPLKARSALFGNDATFIKTDDKMHALLLEGRRNFKPLLSTSNSSLSKVCEEKLSTMFLVRSFRSGLCTFLKNS